MDTNGNLRTLLLKDLCSRLPYRVKVLDDMGRTYELPIGNTYLIDLFYGNGDYIEVPIRPYLRPMSSMTEEEEEEWWEFENKNTIVESHSYSVDWLNKHHFDYRGLIEKGLALEAPDGMYKTKED